MIESIQTKALRQFWVKGDQSAVKAEWRLKVGIVLDALDAAVRPTDLDKPGFGFHALTGDMRGRFAVSVSRNWRITFGWSGENAIDVKMEDYHGR